MSRNDGGPAFPTAELDGMTLRDWFAGQALVGLATLFLQAHGTVGEIYKGNAEIAYMMADAMLAEREKPE